MTRALLLSTYIKFINLFPEIRSTIQDVFRQHSNLRSADAELQQRASEYLQLSIVASPDVLATVLEEMPSFPERDSILTALKKRKPGRVPENDIKLSKSPVPTQNNTQSHNHTTNSTSNTNATSNATSDLLGLSTPPSSNNQNALIDVLGDIYNNSNSTGAGGTVNNAKRFIFKGNGVLFENELIQIGVKSEFRQNLGRISLFYGNKTQVPLQQFTPTLLWSPDNALKLNVQLKPVEPVLEAGAQIQQQMKAECVDDYIDTPSLDITFRYNGVQKKISLKIPLTVNKFFEPTEMNAESFFARWKNLGGYVFY